MKIGYRKIVMLGTTGSGKTSFLKNMVGEFDGAEVKRNIRLEENQRYNTFTPLSDDDFVNSTTTISINAQPVVFIITKTNQFQYYKLKSNELPIPMEEIDCIYPTIIIDTAGQERFEFMQDIGVYGADAAFIFADGSNVASIERVRLFIAKIKEEEKKSKKKIPITVFVNKKDLETRGLYVGKTAVSRWIEDKSIGINETSNFYPDTFLIPIRNVLDVITGFPIPIEAIEEK